MADAGVLDHLVLDAGGLECALDFAPVLGRDDLVLLAYEAQQPSPDSGR